MPRFLLALLLLFCPALLAAESMDALEQLLANHPDPEGSQPPALPRWADVRLTAASPPILGEPFAVEARLEALLADLPDAEFEWTLPRGAQLLEGKGRAAVALTRGSPVRLAWKLAFSGPLSIVEGQLTLALRAKPPRREVLAQARAVSRAFAAAVEKELTRQAGASQAVTERLEIAVSAREGFVGFTPLVWGSYLSGDGFYVGTGSFMDTNFSAQDLVAEAEKQLMEGKPREARALLEKARVDLRPGAEADPLLRWEALNCEALCLYQSGDRARAKELWKQTAADPALADLRRYAVYNIGESLRLEGNLAEARAQFAEAARAKPAFRLPLAKMK